MDKTVFNLLNKSKTDQIPENITKITCDGEDILDPITHSLNIPKLHNEFRDRNKKYWKVLAKANYKHYVEQGIDYHYYVGDHNKPADQDTSEVYLTFITDTDPKDKDITDLNILYWNIGGYCRNSKTDVRVQTTIYDIHWETLNIDAVTLKDEYQCLTEDKKIVFNVGYYFTTTIALWKIFSAESNTISSWEYQELIYE